jgi:Xaa-Pro dipeptidase
MYVATYNLSYKHHFGQINSSDSKKSRTLQLIMHNEQRLQTHAMLQEKHLDYALFARPESVKWLTGFAPPVQVGLSFFAAGLPMVWYEKGTFTLVTPDWYANAAAAYAQERDGGVVMYTSYTVTEPIASGEHLSAAFNALAKPSSIRSKVGIEREFVSQLIAAEFSNAEFVAIDSWVDPLRAVKTAEELAKLRRNFALGDIGHAAARKAVVAGAREIDVWNAMHSAVQAAAGQRVAVGNDCVVGYRSPNNIGGWPADLEIREGDSVIVDISTILDGYWSDSCAVYYAGERSHRQEKIHKLTMDALALGISMIKPGAIAKDIDAALRKFIEDAGYPVYPHHTGHGVGVSGHEAPRIVPYSDEVLSEGMVIMLEPGTYFPGEIGVRLEDAVLVTATGAEVLTHHDKS